jgi:hypothetical protein
MTPRRLVFHLLVFESFAVVIWWCVVLSSSWARRSFFPVGLPRESVVAFLGGDALLVAAAVSAVIALRRGSRWATPLVWLHTGLGCYAMAYTIALSFAANSGYLGAVTMSGFVVPLVLAIAMTNSSDAAVRP